MPDLDIFTGSEACKPAEIKIVAIKGIMLNFIRVDYHRTNHEN